MPQPLVDSIARNRHVRKGGSPFSFDAIREREIQPDARAGCLAWRGHYPEIGNHGIDDSAVLARRADAVIVLGVPFAAGPSQCARPAGRPNPITAITGNRALTTI